MAHILTIKESVENCFRTHGIQSKADLDAWCLGFGRKRLYDFISVEASEDWQRLQKPKERVRFCYQELLPGYSIYAA